MAFLRFHRDKRGYEHFYLVEATTRRGKTRARVLYWFRTPPNVKVGRVPFDDDVRRALETQNPGVIFDWHKISETPIPSADAERWRERRRQERAARAAHRGAGEEPEIAEIDEDGAELPENAEPDVAVDAAEQQADALAPTEESLVSTAATIESSAPPTGSGGEAPEPLAPAAAAGGLQSDPRWPQRRRRRRRHGRRPDVRSTADWTGATHVGESGQSAEVEGNDPGESGDPGEPTEPVEPREPH
jgi:hypothetical protein